MLRDDITELGEASFSSGGTADQLAECEAILGHALPGDLRTLLAESNGITGEYGLGLLWSAERIAKDNSWFRTFADYRDLYMPFDGLVFFADAGNGDQFAVSLAGNQEVYVWNHENDSRTWIAPTIRRYLEGWMTGRIKV